MAKAKAPIYATGFGVLAYGYIAAPDDKAIEGASWKPDGKYKGTIVADDDTHDALRATLIAGLRAQFPQAPDDDDLLILPIKAGETMGEKKAAEFSGKTLLEAKSDYKPTVYDSLGQKVPEGVTARSGDTVRFKVSPYFFSKDEDVVERIGGKTVKTKQTVYGASLRLYDVQIKRKGGGGGGTGFDAIDDGEFDGATAEPEQTREKTARPARTADTSGSGDF